MLSREELDRIAAEDEKRLGVGSKEFSVQSGEYRYIDLRYRGFLA